MHFFCYFHNACILCFEIIDRPAHAPFAPNHKRAHRNAHIVNSPSPPFTPPSPYPPLTPVMHCDRILVLRGGRVAEQGTHAGLLATPGSLYAELWDRQARQASTCIASSNMHGNRRQRRWRRAVGPPGGPS